MNKFSVSPIRTCLTLVWLLVICVPAFAQDTKQDEQDDGDELAAIIGSFSLPKGLDLDFEWKEFKAAILEKVELDYPPFPDDWAGRTMEQRRQWLGEFSASEAGKKFDAKQEAKLAARKVFPIDVEADGTYSVYDVPPNDYVIEGWITKEAKADAKIRYRLDAFGEFSVGKVNEVELGEMELLVNRIFAEGDRAPKVSGKQLDGEALSLSDFKGSYVLIDYWAAGFGSGEFMMPQLKKVQEEIASKYKLKILSISLDEKKADTQAFVKKHGITWPQIFAGDWEHEAVTAFGVRSSPSFWLIDPKGNIALTNGQIMQRYGVSQSLAEILEDNISGENKLAPPPLKEPTETESRKK